MILFRYNYLWSLIPSNLLRRIRSYSVISLEPYSVKSLEKNKILFRHMSGALFRQISEKYKILFRKKNRETSFDPLQVGGIGVVRCDQ